MGYMPLYEVGSPFLYSGEWQDFSTHLWAAVRTSLSPSQIHPQGWATGYPKLTDLTFLSSCLPDHFCCPVPVRSPSLDLVGPPDTRVFPVCVSELCYHFIYHFLPGTSVLLTPCCFNYHCVTSSSSDLRGTTFPLPSSQLCLDTGSLNSPNSPVPRYSLY